MEKRILVLWGIIISVFLISLILSDSQLAVFCGGNNQTMIGCIGDSQLSFTGYIITSAPSVALIKPENGTYMNSNSIPLQYYAPNANNILYSLDSGENITLTSNTTFNAGQGQHIIYIYANNSYGLTTQNVTFTVNNAKFTILYNSYSGSNKGSSTNFNASTYEDIQNLSGVVLENSNYGRIQFNSAINLTNDKAQDNKLDLDSYTNISSNYIYINSTALPNLNTSATLYLYNLTFVNPQILMDGSPCPASICTLVNYSGGTLIFNVTHFSSYSAQETPTNQQAQQTQTSTSGGIGGNNVQTIPIQTSFSINTDTLSVSLNQGQVKADNITITNNQDIPINVQISQSSSIQNLIKVIPRNRTINPDESANVTIDFIATSDLNPNLYVGKLIVTSDDGTEKDIFVAMNVQSNGALLDVGTTIPIQFQEISPGNDISTQIQLYNLGSSPKVDVNLEYIIKDFEGNVIIDQNETVAIQTQEGFVRTFLIPNNANYGKYVFYVKATYNGQTAGASADFDVVTSTATNYEKTIFIIISLSSLVIIVLLYLYARKKIRGSFFTKRIKNKIGVEDIVRK